MCLDKRRKFNFKLGFTLIELLVVIVIIGILATLTTVALTSARAKARDARRISDLKQISSALELYYADYNAYPSTITFGSALVGANSKTYMAKVPSNPTPRAEGACGDLEYKYAGSASDYSLIGCVAKSSGDATAGARVVSVGGMARDMGPTNGIVGWWLMDSAYLTSDNKVGDLSGNNNHGTITGATLTANQLGQANKAYNFNDGTQVIIVNDSSVLKPAELTVSLYFKINQWNTGLREIFFTKWNGWSVEVHATSFRPYFRITNASDSPYGPVLALNTWYHYVGTYKQGVGNTLYIDGNSTGASCPSCGAITYTANGLSIGRYDVNQKLPGDISDARVYNRALSYDEVRALYNATKPEY